MTHPERKYTIGRSPDCDIVLADDSVSRVHAELAFLEDGKLLVTDCHSTQGTSLLPCGGELRPIRQALVLPLDTLRFGSVALPVKELLQAIRLKYPPVAAQPAAGADLLRCACGAVKVKNNRCGVCGL